MARNELQLYPDFTAEIEEIEKNGISTNLLYKIIQKHQPNALYNRDLYKRYTVVDGYVPIFNRQPRYEEEENPINNKVNNDFFGEIVDFKTGYFAGEPITYGYSHTDESEEATGGEQAVEKATKVITDFTTRNNMYGVDMETTKNATCYGYSGRLFYIDNELNERVMPIHGFETIILSNTSISEPEYAVRYFENKDINGVSEWTVEFYDDKYKYTYKGQLLSLNFKEKKPHMFDYCPLQGIPNNREYVGDAEKVLAAIDDYDKVVSDNSNEIEAFVHALMLVGVNVDDSVIRKAQKSGTIIIPQVGSQAVNEPVKWVTKNVNDAFTEHHLARLEDNIYRFSRTPNMNDTTFGTASGQSLKFKLHSLETKCATFEANVMGASQHMWKVLCSSWAKKGIKVDPLQITMEFQRNFPLDTLQEAQTAQALIGAGLPKEWVYSQMRNVDDVDYIMQMIEEEKGATTLYEDSGTVNQSRLYKCQINMIQEYSEKIKSGEISEEKALKMLKASVSIPESELRDLLDLKPHEIEKEATEILQEKNAGKGTLSE